MKSPNEKSHGDILTLDVGLIDPDPKNRKEFELADLKSLADSIDEEGQLQPILVRLHPSKSGRYMIEAGERRWRARLLAKAKTIEARLVKSETEVGAVKKRAAENFQRVDLSPIEEARIFRELHIEHKLPQAEVAKIAGRGNQSTVANSLRLLELPADVQDMLEKRKLTRAHGVALCKYSSWAKACKRIAELAIEHETPAKTLEGKLPFGEDLVEDGLAVDLKYWYSRSQLPSALKESLAVVEGESWDYQDESILCFDLKLGNQAVSTEESHRAAQSKSRSSSSGGGSSSDGKASTGMSAAELRARNEKIAENKQNRVESVLGRTAVLDHLKVQKDIDGAALAVVAMWAFESHWKIHDSKRIKAVAEHLGIKIQGRFGTDELSKLSALKPVDLLRLAAGCICDRESEEGEKYTNPISEEVAHVLGEKKTSAVKKAAADQLAKAAAAKAAKQGGRKS